MFRREGGNMMLNPYIHEQPAATKQHDLLEAAERSRLVAQARQHRSQRQPFRLRLSWLDVERCLSPLNTAAATRSGLSERRAA
jgi:hypothetical protein